MKVPIRSGTSIPKTFLAEAGLPRFAPGDLITAEQLNLLVDAIVALRMRVAELEGRSPA